MTASQGIAALPGFAESLRLLLTEEQYTLHDVAMMFGVTRERIRQLANKYGYTERDKWSGLRCIRVWHDGEHRFRPIHKRIIHRLHARERAARTVRTRTAKYEARWQQAVTELRDLARVLGRTPTITELSRALGLGRNPGVITAYIYPASQRKASQSMAPLWRAAGLSTRPTGGPGHTRGGHRPGARSTHCRRGHPRTAENTYVYRTKDGAERWQCRVCNRITEKKLLRLGEASRKAPLTPHAKKRARPTVREASRRIASQLRPGAASEGSPHPLRGSTKVRVPSGNASVAKRGHIERSVLKRGQ